MCDQGHILIFSSKDFEIRKEGSNRLVAIAARTPNKIYILNDIGKESCFLGKEVLMGVKILTTKGDTSHSESLN